MKLKCFLWIYGLLNLFYMTVGVAFDCLAQTTPDTVLGYMFFTSFCALPCTVGFVLLNHFFSPAAIARFPSRREALLTHILLDGALAFLLTSLLFFLVIMGRLLFRVPYEEGGALELANEYVRYAVAAVQLSLLGKVFQYSNVRYLSRWGYLAAFAFCILELDWLFRMARYNLPFMPKIIFSWAILEHSPWGYLGAAVVTAVLLLILGREIRRKELI